MAMTNLRILYNNYIDAATLSASPAMVVTLPEENLKRSCRCTLARTTSLATQTILGNLAATRTVSGFAAWRHNLTDNATIQFEGYTGLSQGGSRAVNSGAVSAVESGLFDGWSDGWTALWFTPAAIRSFRLTLKDAAKPDGYMQITRAILGEYISPTYNASYGLNVEWKGDAKITRTDGGSLFSDAVLPFRGMDFKLEALSEEGRAEFMEMTRHTGMREDFFISMFPEVGGAKERDYSMMGKLTQHSKFTAAFYSGYTQSFQIQET
jgi:hypothetical protein